MQKSVSEFMSDLSFGPVGSLSMGQQNVGMINPKEEARVISLMNKGLTRLHSRFILHEDEVAIRFIEDQYKYPLMKDRIVTNDGSYEYVVPSYIVETATNQFTDNVIKVLSVFTFYPDDEDDLVELPLNDEDEEDSVFVTNARELQLRSAWPGQIFYVAYQANHPKVSADRLDDMINLPPFLWEALEAFVAARIFRSMSGEAHLITAGVLEAQYEAICVDAESKDLVQSTLYSTKTVFEARGWR